jgi:hypothetical protein
MDFYAKRLWAPSATGMSWMDILISRLCVTGLFFCANLFSLFATCLVNNKRFNFCHGKALTGESRLTH